MKLIAIGELGNYIVYINMTKEEALAKYKKYNPDETPNVKEIEVKNGQFGAYEVWEVFRP